MSPRRAPISFWLTAQASAAEGAARSSGKARHAVLHDFCLCIPYGCTVAVGGLVGMVFGGGLPSLAIAAAGAFHVMLSNISLKNWRAQRDLPLVTVTEAGQLASSCTWPPARVVVLLCPAAAIMPHNALLYLLD